MGFKLRKKRQQVEQIEKEGFQLSLRLVEQIRNLRHGQTVNASTGYILQQIPANTTFEITVHEDSQKKGIHVSKIHLHPMHIGKEIVGRVFNMGKQTTDLPKGHKLFKGILKSVTDEVPDILPFLAETNGLGNKKIKLI